MTPTSRSMTHKSNRSTSFFRRNVLVILLALVFVFGTCSAKNKPKNHDSKPDGSPKGGGCSYHGTNDVAKEIAALKSEVARMDKLVGELKSNGLTAQKYKAVALEAVCSEHKQNGSRDFLAKKGNVQNKGAEIRKLIDQITAALETFAKGTNQTAQKAAELATTVTNIRGKAKPSKAILSVNLHPHPLLINTSMKFKLSRTSGLIELLKSMEKS
ncbi:hypothetical protein DFH28DRAFT_879767 [Melampsora americana]|nr:hypothetical protein DFH28DRAFT_879767 [Melampsora americana]